MHVAICGTICVATKTTKMPKVRPKITKMAKNHAFSNIFDNIYQTETLTSLKLKFLGAYKVLHTWSVHAIPI